MKGFTRQALRLTAAGICLGAHAAAATADNDQGRLLYQGYVPFAAGDKATDNRLPPAFAACARCHGIVGQGGREGGVDVPPLALGALMQPRGGLRAFASSEEIGAAIGKGTGRGGPALSPAMPRYSLTKDETAAILSYLGRIGTAADQPPGVSETEIRLGVLLPLSGPAGAVGQKVLAGLGQTARSANEGGGIHGRRLVLVIEDTATEGALAAARRLLADPVFAIVSGLWDAEDTKLEALLESKRVSSLGNLVVRERASDTGEWDIDLPAPRDIQQSALTLAMAGCREPRLALRIGPTKDPSGKVTWFSSGAPLVHAIAQAGAKGCVGYGLDAVGELAAKIPAGWQQRIVFPVPAAVLSPGNDRAGGWQRLGEASARLAVELLSASGVALNEHSPVEAAKRLQGFSPFPDAPVRLGRTRRYAWDAEVISVPASVDPDQARSPSNTGG